MYALCALSYIPLFFRGRKVELPEGVHGVVLREQPCPDGVRQENEDVTSYWAVETSFRDVMVRTTTNLAHPPAMRCHGRPSVRPLFTPFLSA